MNAIAPILAPGAIPGSSGNPDGGFPVTGPFGGSVDITGNRAPVFDGVAIFFGEQTFKRQCWTCQSIAIMSIIQLARNIEHQTAMVE